MNAWTYDLRQVFRDKDYAHAYVDEFLNIYIATQIKVLREQRGWTQKQLAERVGMKQERISLLENANYEAWSIKTLKKLAGAFDLVLSVSFEEFGNRIKLIDDFDRISLQRVSREHEVDSGLMLSAHPKRESPNVTRAIDAIDIGNRPQSASPAPTLDWLHQTRKKPDAGALGALL
jgi:transcriptional regulator with XRE-family HTH domain